MRPDLVVGGGGGAHLLIRGNPVFETAFTFLYHVQAPSTLFQISNENIMLNFIIYLETGSILKLRSSSAHIDKSISSALAIQWVLTIFKMPLIYTQSEEHSHCLFETAFTKALRHGVFVA